MIDFGIGAVFAIWGIGSVLVYVPKYSAAIRTFDLLAMFPEWRFFAPNPGRGDFFLLYRDRTTDEYVTDWAEVPLVRPRRWWSGAWNPRRREGKALFDTVTELVRIHQTAPSSLLGSISFLTILQYISTRPRLAEVPHTQFLILYRSSEIRGADPQPVYVSEFHRI